MDHKKSVSVIGGHKCTVEVESLAESVGRIIAEEGYILICGGLKGVMEAACRGAKSAGGLTVGIIPTNNKNDANQYVDIVVPTGMGYSRNTIVASAGDIVIALPGEYGTLSEMGFALSIKKTVYGIKTWDIKGVKCLDGPEDVREVLRGK